MNQYRSSTMTQKMKCQYCLLVSVVATFLLVMYSHSDYVLTSFSIEENTVLPQSGHENILQSTDKIITDFNKTEYKNTVFTSIEDIEQSDANIFFIETRCATNKSAEDFKKSGKDVLTARQGCAIESTARTNPSRNIYVFISCFVGYIYPPFLQELSSLPNMKLVHLDPEAILKNTSAQRIIEKGLLETSAHPVEHSSDVLRLALLWKYGGTYFDLDMVTIRSLDPLGTDWAGMQDSETIDNGGVNVSPSGPGHELLGRALEKIAETYDPTSWSGNGPVLLTSLILDLCHVDKVEKAVLSCQDFTVLNRSVLYPLNYPSWGELFDDSRGLALLEEVERTTFSVHVWNKMSHDKEVRLNSTQAYALLANKFCPAVIENVEEF